MSEYHEAYQIRALLDYKGHEGPSWTRDNMRGAEGLARNVVKRLGIVMGIFAGPHYQERVRVLLAPFHQKYLRVLLDGPVSCSDPLLSKKEYYAHFVRLGWVAVTSAQEWILTEEGKQILQTALIAESEET